MKKAVWLCGAITVLVFWLACEGPEGPQGPEGTSAPFITLEPATLKVKVGDTVALKATTSDRQETYTWATTDENVAAVNNGQVTGVSEGLAFITVKGDKSKASAFASVTVTRALATEISFSQHILPLFTSPNAWYPGSEACTSCHFAINDESAHQMDLNSWEGLMKGADSAGDPPGESLLGESRPGAGDFNWEKSKLRARLRDNRMPQMPGWNFQRDEANRNGPDLEFVNGHARVIKPHRYTSWDNEDNVPNALSLIAAWVNAGAPDTATFTYFGVNTLDFETDVLPLFTQHDIWFPGAQACGGCHFANSVHSAHEMDLTTYQGIRKGADPIGEPPGESILGESAPFAGDFNWNKSELRHRLRDNRMPPPAWPFLLDESNRDGPLITHPVTGLPVRAVDLIGEWVHAGAKNN
ncbi:MAG: hypothetical protein ONB48_03510 [candidate division KSB1 bacterium]|nr:hypothetical protein [candidate division KSB1 bacterium]MDZ7275593.1 hypothetical protein [candidate division KSB1 bacterium]MDZ7284716.1 hypothetical protein [candidate division KSB1 bacterium]MDZ7297865.1 hypothetical protein [candidate division KSB1 bacterium]MDZ7309583.1 hypothetical protein [candidate division KSB1 bacterium]